MNRELVNLNPELDTMAEWRTKALAWAKKLTAKKNNKQIGELNDSDIFLAMITVANWNDNHLGDMMVNKYGLSPFNAEHKRYAFWVNVRDGARDWLSRKRE